MPGTDETAHSKLGHSFWMSAGLVYQSSLDSLQFGGWIVRESIPKQEFSEARIKNYQSS